MNHMIWRLMIVWGASYRTQNASRRGDHDQLRIWGSAFGLLYDTHMSILARHSIYRILRCMTDIRLRRWTEPLAWGRSSHWDRTWNHLDVSLFRNGLLPVVLWDSIVSILLIYLVFTFSGMFDWFLCRLVFCISPFIMLDITLPFCNLSLFGCLLCTGASFSSWCSSQAQG